MKNTRLTLLAAALLSLSSNGAFAATDTDTFTVTATVAPVCEITANDLDFGIYNPLSSVPLLLNTSTIDVTCNLLTAHEVGIDSGANSASVATRKMLITTAGETDTLDYSLGCLVAGIPAGALPVGTACVGNWGETTGVGGDTMLLVGLGIEVPIPMAGEVTALQNVQSGIYQDTLTATVTF